MIREFEIYHGVVFARILHADKRPLTIEPFPSSSNASYVINKKIGIYIKHSSKRMSPWQFTFKSEHQQEIELLKRNLSSVFLVLVCKDDGIACLSYEELKQVLDEDLRSIEWISISRRKREMYSLKGSDGQLRWKIGQNEFPAKLFEDAD